MVRSLTHVFGNPSSVHGFGQQARAAVDRARREVAALINAKPNEVIFTSGGTEANNLAIRGVCQAANPPGGALGRHIVTSSIEHPSVRGVCAALERQGWEVTRLPVYKNGVVRAEDVREALRPDTVLVTIMLANNETGISRVASGGPRHGSRRGSRCRTRGRSRGHSRVMVRQARPKGADRRAPRVASDPGRS
jgi:cysteine desulfurase